MLKLLTRSLWPGPGTMATQATIQSLLVDCKRRREQLALVEGDHERRLCSRLAIRGRRDDPDAAMTTDAGPD